ncbi:MAG TPA: hypothetical protein EYQ50_11555 [Verrucomicrobiales bacterium]|nr:hypothetical protein [Verrucomicrobiales bacterium]
MRDPISRLSGAFILTVELPNAVSLVQFYREQIQETPARKRKQVKDAVIRQLATMTKTIHSNNFFHHDLVWRNVLVRLNNEIQPELYWIDCPRGSMETRPFLRNRKRIKDLASLDKCGAVYFSKRERLEFIKIYLGHSSKSQEIRRLISQVQSYRKKRWPDDWLE